MLVAALFLPCLSLISQAADVHVEGLHSMKEKEALDLLGDRLVYVKQRPPSASRAADAAFLLENLMLRQGFQKPQVSYAITGNTVRLIVDEGPRLSVGSVAIPGFPDEEQTRLSKLFKIPGQERVLRPGQPIPFREEDVDEGIKVLEGDFNSRGYWDAKAVVEKRAVDPKTGQIAFVIKITAGTQYHVGPPVFEGAPGDLMASLHQKAAPYIGQIADTDHITKLRGDIEKIFRSTGYPLETFSMERLLEGGKLTPHFIIKFGIRRKLGEIRTDGLQRTHEERVLKRFTDLQNQWNDAEKYDAQIKKLLGTGAFASIRTENTVAEDGRLDATLHIEEASARGTSTYGGIGSYEGAVVGFKYHDRNFAGYLWNFSTGVEVSSRGLLGEVRLSDPWVFDTNTYMGLRLFSVSRTFDGYDKFETGLSAEFSRDDLAKHVDASITLGGSLVNITSTGIPRDELGETIYGHYFVRADLGYDRRDDPVSPTKGYHLDTQLEGGLIVGGTTSNYIKLTTLAAEYIPVGKHGQINLAARTGMLFPSTGPQDFPVDLRLFLGGPDDVRSYAFRDLGPHSKTGDPIGGETYWVANAEYVHSLFGPLKGVGFVDVGNLSPLSGGLDFASPQVAMGLGIRIDLPVGPIRLEYGHNMTQDVGQPSGTWHFSIGTAF
jgi:outer membrane protein assembly factor BamA